MSPADGARRPPRESKGRATAREGRHGNRPSAEKIPETREEMVAFWRSMGLGVRENGSMYPLDATDDGEAPQETGSAEASRTETEDVELSTEGRILRAAAVLFQGRGFEAVGIRDVAGKAGVDKKLIHRHFGAKERLFERVLDTAFEDLEVRDATRDALAEKLTSHALSGSAPLALLTRALGSPVTLARASVAFDERFVKPLSFLLQGPDASLRAGLIAAQMLGFHIAKHALKLRALDSTSEARANAQMVSAIRAFLVAEEG